MPTIKIAEYIDKTCRHSEHMPKAVNIPGPGVYRHICPQCEAEMEFTNVHPHMTDSLFTIVLSSSTVKYTEGKPWPFT